MPENVEEKELSIMCMLDSDPVFSFTHLFLTLAVLFCSQISQTGNIILIVFAAVAQRGSMLSWKDH